MSSTKQRLQRLEEQMVDLSVLLIYLPPGGLSAKDEQRVEEARAARRAVVLANDVDLAL